MGFLSAAYEDLQQRVYRRVPTVTCQACGACCISPHMTLVEFCYLMDGLRADMAALRTAVGRVVGAHEQCSGNLRCRFQLADGRCGVYERRPLACRLHGLRVMEQSGLNPTVRCPHTLLQDPGFKQHHVYELLDIITELNQGYYSYYRHPYWLSGLNVECWLTIMQADLDRPLFRLLRKIMQRVLGLESASALFRQPVDLEGKLKLIEQFHRQLPQGETDILCSLLDRIQNDFSDTGAYYYYEASMYRDALVGQSASDASA